MVTRVKLMNEYTMEWPLWALGGPADEGVFPVSEELAGRLKAWARYFNDHFDWETGWDAEARPDQHAEEAERLRRDLERELGPEYDVVLDLWEAPAP